MSKHGEELQRRIETMLASLQTEVVEARFEPGRSALDVLREIAEAEFPGGVRVWDSLSPGCFSRDQDAA